MKRAIAVLFIIAVMGGAAWAGQFRIAGLAQTPVQALPTTDAGAWLSLVQPNGTTLGGWQWEVIFNRLGLGMHYAVRFYETEEIDPWYLDWKGDFFLSYHLLGGGSVVDPFIEIGWGNAGTTSLDSPDDTQYPDWEEEYENGDAIALALFSYAAAGVAVDLNGLLLGVRLSYIPSEYATPIPATSIDMFDLAEFEVGLFGGVALGGHRRQRHWRSDCDCR